MLHVHMPTTDGRELTLTRYTQPEPELQLLFQRLKLALPPQPPPKITATGSLPPPLCSADIWTPPLCKSVFAFRIQVRTAAIYPASFASVDAGP